MDQPRANLSDLLRDEIRPFSESKEILMKRLGYLHRADAIKTLSELCKKLDTYYKETKAGNGNFQSASTDLFSEEIEKLNAAVEAKCHLVPLIDECELPRHILLSLPIAHSSYLTQLLSLVESLLGWTDLKLKNLVFKSVDQWIVVLSAIIMKSPDRETCILTLRVFAAIFKPQSSRKLEGDEDEFEFVYSAYLAFVGYSIKYSCLFKHLAHQLLLASQTPDDKSSTHLQTATMELLVSYCQVVDSLPTSHLSPHYHPDLPALFAHVSLRQTALEAAFRAINLPTQSSFSWEPLISWVCSRSFSPSLHPDTLWLQVRLVTRLIDRLPPRRWLRPAGPHCLVFDDGRSLLDYLLEPFTTHPDLMAKQNAKGIHLGPLFIDCLRSALQPAHQTPTPPTEPPTTSAPLCPQPQPSPPTTPPPSPPYPSPESHHLLLTLCPWLLEHQPALPPLFRCRLLDLLGLAVSAVCPESTEPLFVLVCAVLAAVLEAGLPLGFASRFEQEGVVGAALVADWVRTAVEEAVGEHRREVVLGQKFIRVLEDTVLEYKRLVNKHSMTEMIIESCETILALTKN